jgi:hypothetical protein
VNSIQTPEDFFERLRKLIDGWCEERNLNALSTVLPSYLAFNGLTDGWSELRDAIKALRASGMDAYSGNDWRSINDLLHYADRALDRS